ncbi:siphovirus Gp157 family protein [Staphylococcus capitis]|uniref:siphovirus Gp157 family protein n=1 Tax=Staphylococcus capitis TaxID=29388 RepID=UPI002480E599|nr:siphovirus Gp157 family protein [Staphylococcus capitis]MDH9600522.1 siphovirus Gp157 family protein [Staphylococcus capitis]MDH9624453.1 siphovirus Gp157 family protein [Staphylococcus capitis]
MSNLFELLISYKQLYNKLDEGYSIEDLQDTLDSIEADMNTKVDNTVGLIRRVEADTDAIDKEIKRLQALKKQKNNFISRLKQHLQDALEIQQKDNYRTSTNYIYKRNNQPSVNITNEALIDKVYRIPQPDKYDKKAMKEDILAGADVEGAELVNSTSLVVK